MNTNAALRTLPERWTLLKHLWDPRKTPESQKSEWKGGKAIVAEHSRWLPCLFSMKYGTLCFFSLGSLNRFLKRAATAGELLLVFLMQHRDKKNKIK